LRATDTDVVRAFSDVKRRSDHLLKLKIDELQEMGLRTHTIAFQRRHQPHEHQQQKDDEMENVVGQLQISEGRHEPPGYTSAVDVDVDVSSLTDDSDDDDDDDETDAAGEGQWRTHWLISLFGLVFRSAETHEYSQTSNRGYLRVLKYLLFNTRGERSSADECIDLQTSNCDSFMKVSRLDVCKFICLHHSFLLKYSKNKYTSKYLRTCKY